MLTRIEGSLAPLAEVELDRGEILFTEPQTLVAVSGATLQTALAGGIAGGLKRAIGGASPFLVEVHGPGSVTLSRGATGRIVELNCDRGPIWLQRQAFLFAPGAIHLDVRAPKSLGSMVERFGHLSPFLLEARGNGPLWAFAWGDVKDVVLGAGEEVDVAPGRIVALDASVTFAARPVGWKNTILGGLGLTLLTLRGPGRVVLQTRDLKSARPKPPVQRPRSDPHRPPPRGRRRPDDDIQEQWLFDDHRQD